MKNLLLILLVKNEARVKNLLSIIDIMQYLKVQRQVGLDALELNLNQCGNKLFLI